MAAVSRSLRRPHRAAVSPARAQKTRLSLLLFFIERGDPHPLQLLGRDYQLADYYDAVADIFITPAPSTLLRHRH